jgi:hypothetical protein
MSSIYPINTEFSAEKIDLGVSLQKINWSSYSYVLTKYSGKEGFLFVKKNSETLLYTDDIKEALLLTHNKALIKFEELKKLYPSENLILKIDDFPR